MKEAHGAATSAMNFDQALAMIDMRIDALTTFRAATRGLYDVFGAAVQVTVSMPAGFPMTAPALPVLEAPVLDAPVPTMRRPRQLRAVPAPTPVPEGRGKGRPAADTDAIDAAVLASVARGLTQGKPIAVATKVHVVKVRAALARLVSSGQIECHGAGRHAHFRMPGAPPVVGPKPTGRPSKTTDRDAEIVAFLERQTAPIKTRTLIEALGVSAVPVQQAIKRLAASGQIVAVGSTANRRIGIPRVMERPGTAAETIRPARATSPAPRARATAPRATKAPKRETSSLEAAVLEVLKTGASEEPRRIRLKLLTAFPDVTVEAIAAFCEGLVREQRLARIVVGSSPTRYQLRVRK